MLEQLRDHLDARKNLSEAQIFMAVEQLADESVSVELKADFLTRLALKGETAEEIGSFVRALRERSLPVPGLDHSLLLDVVGTGGDRLGTFNISTTVALLAAAAGVAVAKHGNRASTSPVGSADVLEALGIPFDLGPEEAVRSLRQHGFAFFFAPKYHPAFKHIIPARKLCAARGQSTIFNFLGPLLNPARPAAMLIGVPRPDLCEPLARVLQSLGVRRGMVVCGAVPEDSGFRVQEMEAAEKNIPENREAAAPCYLDELSTLGPTTIAEFYQENGLACASFSCESFPIGPATLADLRSGNDRTANAAVIRSILGGEQRGPKRDIVLANTAAALLVAGRARNLAAGWELAEQTIESGKARAKLEELCSRRTP
ncbi:MAG: anthranilate phosphoribosyltransferase [Verrucomicrobia bacterium]|nr:MAG: anthranilate phosphoribosyltransferase [Verrucomicrobiota bacterium]